MKKITVLFCLLLLAKVVFCQCDFHPLGCDDFNEESLGTASDPDIAIDQNGIPYIAFVDGLNGKVTVRKYVNSQWITVGNAGFTSTFASQVSIRIGSNNLPYVLYKANNISACVDKFNGVSWVTLGTTIFMGDAYYLDFALDANNNPYVAFIAGGSSGYRVSVVRHTGSGWAAVGSLAFSNGSDEDTHITIDQNGDVFVAYNAYSAGATIKKFNGSSWVTYGNIGFASGHIYGLSNDLNGNMYLSAGGSVYHYISGTWTLIGSNIFTAEADMCIDNSGNVYVSSMYNGSYASGLVKKYSAGTWSRIGTDTLGYEQIDDIAIAVAPNGTPYVVVGDRINDHKATVRQFNGTSWVILSQDGISHGPATDVAVALDKNDVPFIVYNDYANNERATVKKYNGTSWAGVGLPGFTTGLAQYPSIAVDTNGTPYVCYIDFGGNGKAAVKRFNGTLWTSLAATYPPWGQASYYTSIAINPIDNVPYIVFCNGDNSHYPTLMKYTGSSWATLGTAGVWAEQSSVVIDRVGTPYITYLNPSTHKISVMKYNGTALVLVGNANFSNGSANFVSLALDTAGTPYVAYTNSSNYKASVMKYNGTSWVLVGNADFTPGTATQPSIYIDKNNFPTVIFSDGTNAEKAAVMQFDNISWNTIGSAGFSAGRVSSPKLIIDKTGSKYAVFANGSVFAHKLTVSCQEDVWPGDANSDGVTDNLDVLELGLHYAQTGSPRATTSNAWQPYFANIWSGTITNGKNLNHSDCNGDGIIDNDDTLAIYNNYGLTHTFKPNQQVVTNPQLSIVPDQSAVVKGTWGTASVYLGDASNQVNNINGVAFTVNFDNTLIETNSVWIEYPVSFINASNQNLKFRKLDFANNNLYTATTHTLSSNVSGNGLIAKLHYQIKSSLTSDEVLNLGIVQANQSTASGTIIPLTSGTATLLAMGSSVGLNESSTGNLVSVSPNPAQSVVSINSTTDLEKVEIVNLTGQVLISESVGENTHRLNVESLANGVYFIKAYTSSKQMILKKLVIQK